MLNILVLMGIVLLLAGLIIRTVWVLHEMGPVRSTERRGGAVIIIGPFPIVFGSDPRTVKILMMIAIMLVAILLALLLLQLA